MVLSYILAVCLALFVNPAALVLLPYIMFADATGDCACRFNSSGRGFCGKCVSGTIMGCDMSACTENCLNMTNKNPQPLTCS